MNQTISLSGAVEMIPDGASIMIGGFMGGGSLCASSTNWRAKANRR